MPFQRKPALLPGRVNINVADLFARPDVMAVQARGESRVHRDTTIGQVIRREVHAVPTDIRRLALGAVGSPKSGPPVSPPFPFRFQILHRFSL